VFANLKKHLPENFLDIEKAFLTNLFKRRCSLKMAKSEPLNARVAVTVPKPWLETIAECLVLSLIVILIDLGGTLLYTREPGQIASILSLIMLVEGALGLTAGGMVAFYSPLGAKIGEIFFHSEPWNATRQKEAEKQARAWIIIGCILIFAALLVSAL
jgi:hypothetical protein